ncbi:hypothetical protein [Kitasatospora sp. NPDC059327]|uniref:hypothetical protein n=1 Tax=Kitasatospora sp. NPDC059327 TaxID=3346803 RepID=UPI00367DE5EF
MTEARSAAYAGADQGAARLYRILGLLPSATTAIHPAMAGAAAGLDPAATTAALDVLVARGLLNHDDGGHRFASLPARRHAAALAESTDTPATRARAIRRALDWLLTEATAASRRIDPTRRTVDPPVSFPPAHRLSLFTTTQARAFLTDRGPHLTTTLTLATTHHRAAVPYLVHACWPYYLRAGDHKVTVAHHTKALSTDTALPPLVRRELLGARATALRARHLFPAALEDAHEALALARRDQDQVGIAQHQHDIGATLHEADAFDLANTYLARAYQGRAALGRHRDAAITLLTQGVVNLDLGLHADAVKRLRTAEEVLAAHGDHYNAARARAWQGRAAALAGDHDRATALLAGAMVTFRTEGGRLWQARVLAWQAEIATAREHVGRAAGLYRQSADLYQGYSLTDYDQVTDALNSLTVVAP